MHCGWLPREDWTPWVKPEDRGIPPALGPVRYEADVCPGWLVRQAAVVEASEAHAAFDKGAMEAFYPPDLTPNNVYEGVKAMSRSCNAFHVWQLKEAQRRRSSG